MMDEKEILCYCHFGGKKVVRKDNVLDYSGGISAMTVIEENTLFDDFMLSICKLCRTDRSGKLVMYSDDTNPNMMLHIMDDKSLKLMYRVCLRRNVDCVHAYIVEENVQPSHFPSKRGPDVHVDSGIVPVAGSAFIERTDENVNYIDNDYEAAMSDENVNVQNIASRVVNDVEHVNAMDSNQMERPDQSSSHSSHRMSGNTRDGRESTAWESAAIIAKENPIVEGGVFKDVLTFKQALYMHAYFNKFAYKFLDNATRYYRVVCKVKDCKWKLTASGMPNTEIVRIYKLNDAHQHSVDDMKQYKPIFRSKYMCSLFAPKVLSSPDYGATQIRRDLASNGDLELTYNQAWWMRKSAIYSVSGKPSDGFKQIPWLCERIKLSIPGSHVEFEVGDHDGRFKHVFVSYGPFINGFNNVCRPILFIDACFLKGHYGGVLMMAAGLDSDNEVYPLAYQIAVSESDEDWDYFLQNLHKIIGDRQVVLMTDKNTSLLRGIEKIFGKECNSWCLHRLKERFHSYVLSKTKWRGSKVKGVAKMLDDIAYARSRDEFNRYLSFLGNVNQDFAQWVCDNEPKQWARAFFPMKRWDCLTMNPTQSMIAMLPDHHDMNIESFMKDHIVKMNEFLLSKKAEMEKWESPVSNHVEKIIRKEQLHSQDFHSMASSAGLHTVFDVVKTQYAVCLSSKTCSCLKWYQSGIPCQHAMHAAGVDGVCIYELVDTCFLKDTQHKLLSYMLPPVPTNDQPSSKQIEEMAITARERGEEVIIPLPPLIKRSSGRPKRKRVETQYHEKRTLRCGHCHGEGHNKRNCNRPCADDLEGG